MQPAPGFVEPASVESIPPGSVPEAAPPPLYGEDLRDAPRHAMVIRAAKLSALGVEFVCLLRDVSETGVSISLFHPVPLTQFMVLELQNGDTHDVELVWSDGGRAGFRLMRRTGIARLIETHGRFARRPIRVRMNVPARLFTGLRGDDCAILDLSQHGARLSCSAQLAEQQRVKLAARGLERLDATVRWARDGEAGLLFERAFQLGELALIAAALQHGGAVPSDFAIARDQ